MPRKSQREPLLDAAEQLVLDEGVAALTLNGVARAAGVSKGGLLYHFESKAALVAAMVERVAARFAEAQDRHVRKSGDAVSAYVDATFPRGKPARSREDQLGASLLAAYLNDPELLAPLRERYEGWQERLEENGDPVAATIVRLAVDGLWLADLFGLAPPAGKLRKQVLERLRGGQS